MKVRDLIEMLENADPNDNVVVGCEITRSYGHPIISPVRLRSPYVILTSDDRTDLMHLE